MNEESGRLPIVIAGAGIAGLSAAIALALEGVYVHVYEKGAEIAPIGAGIQLGPNATRILARWGVELPASACEPEAVELRNAKSGKLMNAIPLGQVASDRYGAPYRTLLRADLQSLLFDRAESLGVPFSFGCGVNAAEHQGGVMSVQTTNGDIKAAGLLAADGVNSVLQACVPKARRAVYTRTTIWRALLPARALPAPMRQVVTLWMGSGAHLVHYPVEGGASLNAVLAIENDGVYAGGARKVMRSAADLLPRLKDWSASTIAPVEAAAEWQAWPLFEIPSGGESGGRRVQLIGDAWHAMRPYLASGGAMAIEDAAAMARAFAAARHSVPRALYLFRLERGPRVRLVASQSQRMGRLYHLSQPYAAARDASIRSLKGLALLKRNDWLYAAKDQA